MSSINYSDTFFFVATIAIVLITALIVWGFVYIIRILKNIKEFTDTAKAEGRAIISDIKEVRSVIKSEVFKLKNLSQMALSVVEHLGKFLSKKSVRKNKKSASDKEEEGNI